ncbi:unnamed protein product [Caenorhabditis angaria]|uniref:Protein kinase domain-containing protein n=1 Tax=Caenorhabditis angaria TaxID=860376 RepID=A0A9P1IAU0_9PELO|nr:unnamed protein product [Caenorhabditis angaria]
MVEFEKDEKLPDGTVVGGRFKIVKKLGEGGCGSVFKVEDIENNNLPCAMKVEYSNSSNGNVLKLEVQILQALVSKKHVAKLIFSGKKPEFSYVVMTLLGESLCSLIAKHGPYLNVTSQIRIGISLLFGVKQIHDTGYIHRDLKPANIALGYKGTEDERLFLVLDFGLARQFVAEVDGKLALRRPRERALFRGTARYCSIAMLEREEQSRADDIWAVMYILAEMRCKLPWHDFDEKTEILASKKKTSDEILFSKSPVQLLEFAKEVRKLNFYSRPEYDKLFLILNEVMKQADFKWSDPYHWENQNVEKKTAEKKKTKERSPGEMKKSILVERKASTPDKKLNLSKRKKAKDESKTVSGDNKTKTVENTVSPNETPYFTVDDFTSNPIGF